MFSFFLFSYFFWCAHDERNNVVISIFASGALHSNVVSVREWSPRIPRLGLQCKLCTLEEDIQVECFPIGLLVRDSGKSQTLTRRLVLWRPCEMHKDHHLRPVSSIMQVPLCSGLSYLFKAPHHGSPMFTHIIYIIIIIYHFSHLPFSSRKTGFRTLASLPQEC